MLRPPRHKKNLLFTFGQFQSILIFDNIFSEMARRISVFLTFFCFTVAFEGPWGLKKTFCLVLVNFKRFKVSIIDWWIKICNLWPHFQLIRFYKIRDNKPKFKSSREKKNSNHFYYFILSIEWSYYYFVIIILICSFSREFQINIFC